MYTVLVLHWSQKGEFVLLFHNTHSVTENKNINLIKLINLFQRNIRKKAKLKNKQMHVYMCVHR